jgi:hypothetical protein
VVQDLQRQADRHVLFSAVALGWYISYNYPAWFKDLTADPINKTGKSSITVTVPQCIANGEYLVRFEHIGLHSASSTNGAQLYISCAQVKVTGGSGSYNPSLLSFPGAYSPNDPGLLVNIYYPVPTNYVAPGGPALQC